MSGMNVEDPDRHRVELLPESLASLAGARLDAPAGTIYLLAASGGIKSPPRRGFRLLFGRNEPEVHVCIGADDPHISRCHGRFVCDGTDWWLHNDGRLPIRLPGQRLLLSGRETVLRGYNALFIQSPTGREYLLEARVEGPRSRVSEAAPDDETRPHRAWELSAEERLVLTALAQRYLRQESYPQPQSWKQVAGDLNSLPGQLGWHPHRAANTVERVRLRLSALGVAGLTREEVGEPVGNSLNHNLIQELLVSTTLVPPDLRLLGEGDV